MGGVERGVEGLFPPHCIGRAGNEAAIHQIAAVSPSVRPNWCTQGQIRSGGVIGAVANIAPAGICGAGPHPVRGWAVANIAPARICGASPTRVTYENDGTYGPKPGGVGGVSAFGATNEGGVA